jgi:RES domain-containing protein
MRIAPGARPPQAAPKAPSGAVRSAPPRTVWRLTTARYASRAFDGEGARLHGGRWNHPGTPVVYTAATLSLCALEYLVHVDPSLAPDGLVAIAAEIPGSLRLAEIEAGALPSDWRDFPAPVRLQDLGTGWVRSGETVGLWTPSAVIPHERNLLLNPAHPDFARVRLLPAVPFSFDPRLWRD